VDDPPAATHDEPIVIVGPLALLAFLLAVRALRRRSLRAGAFAVAIAGVETSWPPYRRLLRQPWFRDFDVVTILRDRGAE